VKHALLLLGFVLSALALPAAGCKGKSSAVAATAPERTVVVRPDSDGLLLTWIDDKGDFHVETRVADVPMTGRDTVRVVDPNVDEAGGDRIHVVDLRATGTDGTYPVRLMSRVDFEALAVGRREKSGPTLASAAPAQPSAAPSGGAGAENAPQGSAQTPPMRATVVVYGAEWCGACHEAARYLRRKGIAYVEKDIEKDPGAAREMQAKLERSGLRGGSIPVIDVRGKIMVGFNPSDIDAALGQAL
jgi:glutaredoxin